MIKSNHTDNFTFKDEPIDIWERFIHYEKIKSDKIKNPKLRRRGQRKFNGNNWD